ncbi:MAG TPA: hypothetical protein VGF18_02820, partial [Candidatus Tumulicola sp.]
MQIFRRFRLAAATAVATLALIASTANAPGAVVLSVGIRLVMPSGSVDTCSSKAKAALTSTLTTVGETAPGVGIWFGYGALDSTSHAGSAAAIHCFPVDKGYEVTFTCTVDPGGSPYTADALCKMLDDKFQGRTTTPLAAAATPTPLPTGCATTNLVGTWLMNNSPSQKFTFTIDGQVTDPQGVSGNWNLDGGT